MPSSINWGDVLQAVLSVIGVIFTAYIGYRITVTKQKSEEKAQVASNERSAETEFRNDLIEQLEEANNRNDRQQERLDAKDARINQLLETIDKMWNERVELRSTIATLQAESVSSQRKIAELSAELEKFERKVYYIARPESKEGEK